jgi:hypothetical protein
MMFYDIFDRIRCQEQFLMLETMIQDEKIGWMKGKRGFTRGAEVIERDRGVAGWED